MVMGGGEGLGMFWGVRDGMVGGGGGGGEFKVPFNRPVAKTLAASFRKFGEINGNINVVLEHVLYFPQHFLKKSLTLRKTGL